MGLFRPWVLQWILSRHQSRDECPCRGQIGAFVTSEATLRYLNHFKYGDRFELVQLPTTKVSFAMAARPNFPLLREINIALVAETTRLEWENNVQRWLGPPAGAGN